jgi:hypothetical protein
MACSGVQLLGVINYIKKGRAKPMTLPYIFKYLKIYSPSSEYPAACRRGE